MEELIPLHSSDGNTWVSAKEVHSFLESKAGFSGWMTYRIEQYGFIEGKDFVLLSKIRENSKRGRPSLDYQLTIAMAKELCMVEGNAKGKQAREYFLMCEEAMQKAQQAIQKPMSTAELFALQVRINLEYENRLNNVEGHVTGIDQKLNLLLQNQEEAKNALMEIDLTGNPVPELTLRAKIKQAVAKYSFAQSLAMEDTYHLIYEELFYRYSIKIRGRKRLPSEKSWLDVAERVGCLDKIWDIICSKFGGDQRRSA